MSQTQEIQSVGVKAKEECENTKNTIPGLEEVADENRADYLANYKTFTADITVTQMLDIYTEAANKETYEKVSQSMQKSDRKKVHILPRQSANSACANYIFC